MTLLQEIITTLSDASVVQVCLGLRWTGVVVEREGHHSCGLATTIAEVKEHAGAPMVPQAGHLEQLTALELARLSLDFQPALTSIGTAAINALVPQQPETWFPGNAEHLLASLGAGKRVAVVGHFPFVPRLKECVGELAVLELRPKGDDLPAESAPSVLPRAEVIAITGMAFINHTLEGLLKLCNPKALVVALGPSTPLSPVLFEHGVDIICGAIVTDVQPVMHILSQGANFRQIHRAGVRLVNAARDPSVLVSDTRSS